MAVATGSGRSETPAFLCGGWGEPQPIVRELQQFGEYAQERHAQLWCQPQEALIRSTQSPYGVKETGGPHEA